MRPVRKGVCPSKAGYLKYEQAWPDLVSRLGRYCSYCERRINTQLAVEHEQPKKGEYGHPELETAWDNFLLACVNCNSTKKDKRVEFSELLFPDRDNTFAAYVYLQNGLIEVASQLQLKQRGQAQATLELMGLEKPLTPVKDTNGQAVAWDRISQRMEAWGIAQDSLDDLMAEPDSLGLRCSIVRNACSEGFFSIWMTVFSHDVDMRQRLIDAFSGTRESGCFDPHTTAPVCPAPNPDGLMQGSKV